MHIQVPQAVGVFQRLADTAGPHSLGVTMAGVALFLHIAAVLVMYAAAGVSGVALHAARTADTVADLRRWIGRYAATERVFPAAAVVLAGAGGFLISTGGDASWTTGWVQVGIGTLAAVTVLGACLSGRWLRRLHAALATSPDGPVDSDLRRLARDNQPRLGGNAITGLVTGVVFIMTTKPDTLIALLVVAAGGGVAVAATLLGSRRPDPPPGRRVRTTSPTGDIRTDPHPTEELR